VKLANRNCTIW